MAAARQPWCALPPRGKVHILCFTDKQYERMHCYTGRREQGPAKKNEQFLLF